MTIETARLQLFPYAPEHLLALIEGIPQYEARTGLRAAEGLRDGITSAEVSPVWLEQLRASTAADPWTHGFGVVHQESCLVIGSVGFKGAPDAEGMVEIAYGIVPAFRGKGYATEAAEAAVKFAFASDQVRLVRAHTLPTNSPSMQVLARCGFERTEEVVDPEDGLVIRWERVKALT